MTITMTDLKQNLKKYVKLSEKEDILVTSNGKVVTKLSNPYREELKILDSLCGCLHTEEKKEEDFDEVVYQSIVEKHVKNK